MADREFQLTNWQPNAIAVSLISFKLSNERPILIILKSKIADQSKNQSQLQPCCAQHFILDYKSYFTFSHLIKNAASWSSNV